MDIIQTIIVKATIPNDAVINYAADGKAASFTDKNGNTFKFWAIVEEETPDGKVADLAGEDLGQHGIEYEYDDRYFEVVEPAAATALAP